MKFNYAVAGGLLALSSSAATADVLSFAIGGGVWNEEPTGGIYKVGDPAEVNVKDQFFWKEETQGYLFATLEHPVPILPNVRLSYTTLDHAGSGNANFVFDGDVYTGTVSNDFKIAQTDVLLYWEVLDNVVSLDLGLSARVMDFDYAINDSSNTTDSVSATIPMVYGLIGGSPIPGMLISAEGYYMSYDGSTASDFNAKIAYTSDYFIGFEGGYRSQTIELDDVDNTNANLDFKGPFIGAYLKF